MIKHPTSIYDVIVIGGGPAGSTLATFVAMQGHRVLLLEKEQYPIYKIGESLLPATIHGICPILGVSQALENAKFVLKRGGTFQWGRNPEPWTFLFSTSSKMAGPTSTAYQVERMKFDDILLRNAKTKGVDVRERHSAKELLIEGDRAVGVEYIDDTGTLQTCRARFIVDSSGHQSQIARFAGERLFSHFFQNIALFGYFRGGQRLAPPNQGNIFSVAFKHGWFWYIPLSETLTSVGAVVSKEHASLFRAGHELAFREFIAACPPVSRMLSNASRITDGPYGELRVRKDYSYCHTSFCKDGLVLLGDAACFVDPVFSSGVHLATYSALQAARSINTRLRNELSDEVCFGEFEARYRREYGLFYDFLLGFYDVHSDSQGSFWSSRKIANSAESENEAFINLVAGIGGNREQLYSTPAEFLKSREHLGAALFPGASDSTLVGSHTIKGNKFFGQMLGELSQVQLQAYLKEARPPERPLFQGGLIPSRDGLHWVKS